MEEGWYLMSTDQLERALARVRAGDDVDEAGIVRLSVEEALAYRNAGNIPDAEGRSLRLILRIDGAGDFKRVHEKRLGFEPDYHEAPSWRRAGSKPVNVVPLRQQEVRGDAQAWWEDDDIGRLEREWADTGKVDGVVVPADYRSFVYKTVVALRDARIPVTVDSVADSIARWLPQEQIDAIRAALREANR